jgi:hypothetical protein
MSDRFPRRSAIDRILLGLAAVLAAASPRPASVAPPRAKIAPGLVAYVDVARGSMKRCAACEHFLAPRAPAAKGGCSRVAGPIAPTGHCEIWAPREHD